MSQDDLRLFIAHAEYSKTTAALQMAMAKLFFAHLQNSYRADDLRRELRQLPDDSEEARDIERRLDESEASLAREMTAMMRPLQDMIARCESDHEKMEAWLASAKQMLPPSQT